MLQAGADINLRNRVSRCISISSYDGNGCTLWIRYSESNSGGIYDRIIALMKNL